MRRINLANFLLIILYVTALLPYHFKQFIKVSYGAGSQLLSKLSYGAVGGILVLIMYLALYNRQRRLLFVRGIKSNAFVLLYVIWLSIGQIIGFTTGDFPIITVVVSIGYASAAFIGFYVVPTLLSEKKSMEIILTALMYVGIIVSITGLIGNFTGSRSVFGVTLRTNYATVPLFDLPESYGIIHESNIYGLICGIGLVITFYKFMSNNRWMYLLGASLCAIAVFMSGSRSIYLATIVCFLYLASPKTSNLAKKTLYVIGTITVLSVGLYTALFTKFGEEVLRTGRGVKYAMAGRTTLWYAAIETLYSTPIYGYGFWTSEWTKQLFENGAYLVSDKPTASHNAFLDVSLQGGLPLGILYVVAVIKSLINTGKSYSFSRYTLLQKRAVISVFVYALSSSLFMSHSLGGIGLASLILTTFMGILSLPSYR